MLPESLQALIWNWSAEAERTTSRMARTLVLCWCKGHGVKWQDWQHCELKQESWWCCSCHPGWWAYQTFERRRDWQPGGTNCSQTLRGAGARLSMSKGSGDVERRSRRGIHNKIFVAKKKRGGLCRFLEFQEKNVSGESQGFHYQVWRLDWRVQTLVDCQELRQRRKREGASVRSSCVKKQSHSSWALQFCSQILQITLMEVKNKLLCLDDVFGPFLWILLGSKFFQRTWCWICLWNMHKLRIFPLGILQRCQQWQKADKVQLNSEGCWANACEGVQRKKRDDSSFLAECKTISERTNEVVPVCDLLPERHLSRPL